MGRLFLPGMVVSAENQGTFSDYHDASGDGGYAVDFVFCGCGMQIELATTFGIFEQNDIPEGNVVDANINVNEETGEVDMNEL